MKKRRIVLVALMLCLSGCGQNVQQTIDPLKDTDDRSAVEVEFSQNDDQADDSARDRMESTGDSPSAPDAERGVAGHDLEAADSASSTVQTVDGGESGAGERAESVAFHIDTIAAETVVCVGEIELSPSSAYRLEVAVEEGSGLFVGLYHTADITTSRGIGFDQTYGTSGHSVSARFSGDQQGIYYVYVGSSYEGTDLSNASGTLSPVAG